MISAYVTLALALLTSLGSLYLSLGMKLKACPLCFYQRSFAFAVVGVLVMGLAIAPSIKEAKLQSYLPLLVLPVVLAGLGVAGFHVYLVVSNALECPKGMFDLGSAPLQSLLAFTLILLPVLYGLFVESADVALQPVPLLLGVLLGVGMTLGSIFANPPMPPKPSKPYEVPLEICRPPFVAEAVAAE